VAFVHQDSIAGFNVVSRKADPASPEFGRTPIMIWDGLSVLQSLAWEGPLTDDIRAGIIGDLDDTDSYLLVDGGAYLGYTFLDQGQLYIGLYWRLNPDQPDGRFHGKFDHLLDK
jgi:hypothetical protein